MRTKCEQKNTANAPLHATETLFMEGIPRHKENTPQT